MDYQYGMDYQGGGGGFSQGAGGGGGFSQGAGGGSGQKSRRAYDEQTIVPCTVAMILQSTETAESNLELADGRKIHHIRLVGAVRSVEEFSTNVLYNIEDGTGLLEVKQWLQDNDCTAVAELRQATLKEHIYVNIVGQVKMYDGKRTVMADAVRPLTTGNELTCHLLNVVYAAEHAKRKDAYVAPQAPVMGGVGFGAPATVGAPLMAAGTGSSGALRDVVLHFVQTEGEKTEAGAHVDAIIAQLQGRHSATEVHQVISDLSTEGHVYSTIDESHFKFAM